MAEDKPPPRLGDLFNHLLDVAENDPEQFAEGLKAYKDGFVQNSGELQRRLRNTAIKGMARFVRARIAPEKDEK